MISENVTRRVLDSGTWAASVTCQAIASPFAIEVRREVDGVGRLRGLLDRVDLLAPVLGDHVLGREAVLDVDPELALAGVLGQVADVAVGGQDTVIGAEIALDRPRLGRRLDDHQVLRHRRGVYARPRSRPITGRSTAAHPRLTPGSLGAPADREDRRGVGSGLADAPEEVLVDLEILGLVGRLDRGRRRAARSVVLGPVGISTNRIAAIGNTNVESLKSMNTGRLPSIVRRFVQMMAMSPGFGSSRSSTDQRLVVHQVQDGPDHGRDDTNRCAPANPRRWSWVRAGSGGLGDRPRRAARPARSDRGSAARGRPPRAGSARRARRPRSGRVTATSSSTVTAPWTSASATASCDGSRPDSTAPADGRLDRRANDDLPARCSRRRAAPAAPRQARDRRAAAGRPTRSVARPGQSRRKPLQPADVGASIEPGTTKHSRPCSSAHDAVTRAPLRAPASTTTTASDEPLISRLRCGNVPLLGSTVGRVLGDHRAATVDDRVGQPVVRPREEPGVAAADERDRRRALAHARGVGRAVDADREARDDRRARPRQRRGDPARDPPPEPGSAAASRRRRRRAPLRERSSRAADEQRRRRDLDRQQPARVLGIARATTRRPLLRRPGSRSCARLPPAAAMASATARGIGPPSAVGRPAALEQRAAAPRCPRPPRGSPRANRAARPGDRASAVPARRPRGARPAPRGPRVHRHAPVVDRQRRAAGASAAWPGAAAGAVRADTDAEHRQTASASTGWREARAPARGLLEVLDLDRIGAGEVRDGSRDAQEPLGAAPGEPLGVGELARGAARCPAPAARSSAARDR